MRFEVLGPVEAWDGDRRIDLHGSKLRTFVAVLLREPGRVVSDTSLGSALWRDEPPSTAQAQIHTYASRLRVALGGEMRIERRPPGYRMELGAHDYDLLRFEELVRTGRAALATGDAAAAAGSLAEALSLWRGPALGGVTESFAAMERDRLEEARLAALEDRIEADLALGRHVTLMAELSALVAEHPLRERLRAQLILALHRSGRRADALTAYRECRETLVHELGVEPGADLQELHRLVLDGASADSRHARPAGAASVVSSEVPSESPRVLPAEPPEFTGRTRVAELAVAALSAGGAARTCVISGLGGAGKSVLALHLARRLRTVFPDGQVRIDLGGSTGRPMSSTTALVEILRSLDVAPAPVDPLELREAYHRRLAGRRILLVLEGASSEHQVRPLLPQSDGCAAIVTSRAVLAGIAASNRIDLGMLTSKEAVGLLSQIVGAHRVQAEELAARRIVAACGGLPLAVRICGTRLTAHRHWSLQRLAERLGDDHQVLDQLVLGDRDVRRGLELDYQALSPGARVALRLLSLPREGDLSLWAVAALLDLPLSQALDPLDELIGAHLLQVFGGDVSHYRLHPLVRAFARERSRAEDTGEDRAAAFDRLHDPLEEHELIPVATMRKRTSARTQPAHSSDRFNELQERGLLTVGGPDPG